jgi:hypothetical protein
VEVYVALGVLVPVGVAVRVKVKVGVSVLVLVGVKVPVTVNVCVGVPVYVDDGDTEAVALIVGVGAITVTKGIVKIPSVISPLAVLSTGNAAAPAVPCAVAPGPPEPLLPYDTVIVPFDPIKSRACIIIFCPETETPIIVPRFIDTVKYPASVGTRLGADHPAGIVILSVPYPGADAHVVMPFT